MAKKPSQAYVRCFWTGKMQLLNGQYLPLNCTHISNKQIEVEVPRALVGSPKIMLELDALHNGVSRHIKAVCGMDLDVLNEHDKHYIKLHFEHISQADSDFIERFVMAHA